MDGLASYIQGGQPQVAVGDQSLIEQGGAGLTEVVASVSPGEPTSGAGGNTDPSGQPPPGSQDVTTPDPRDEAIRHLQSQLDAQAQETARIQQAQDAERQAQAQASARYEEAQILAQINAIPDEDERQQVLSNYTHNRDVSIIQTQAAQIESIQREKERVNQEVARNSVVTIRAIQEGIPTDFLPLLKRSDSPQELEANLQLIRRSLGQGQVAQQQATRQEIVTSGVYAAGGDQTGFIPPEMPKERSGDLAGLIASTPPRFS